jgi:methylase of polypeptide subunit release factors
MEKPERAVPSPSATPDLSRLASWPAPQWRAFGDRLHAIGLSETSLESLDSVLPNALPRLSIPLKRWTLRQNDCDVNSAARLLVLGDEVNRKQAESAFGADLLRLMIDSNMLEEKPNELLLSRFRMHLAKGMYFLSDDLRLGADAVMGLGNTTLGLLMAVRGENLGRVLDLGCGAGAMALVLSSQAGSVVATDINPRALVFGRINAAINGVENVEFREGDLYEPVKHDAFDLIVSQPPFIPMPENSAPTTYLFGGIRGDELPLRVMAGAAPRLREGGRAVILIQWPELEGDPIDDRVRSAVSSSEVDLLLVNFPSLDANTFCLAYSSFTQRELGVVFETDLIRWRAHFGRMKVSSMRHCFNILRKNSKRRGWTKEVFPAMGHATPSSIDRIFARYDLLSAGDQALLSAKLIIREDAILETEQPIGKSGKQKSRIRFSGNEMNRPAELNNEMVKLIRAVHRADSVRAGVHKYSGDNDPGGETLAAVRDALELGLLEVAETGNGN